jgi:hypothetical protein
MVGLEIPIEAAKREFSGRRGRREYCRRPARRKPEQIGQANQNRHPHDEALRDVCPDHGLDAALQCVEHRHDADHQDQCVDLPSGHAVCRERDEVVNEAHLAEVAEREGRRGVGARRRAEAVADVFVGAHADGVAVERDQHRRGHREQEDEKEAGHQQGPVSSISRAWVSHEGNARNQRCHDRHPCRPRRHPTAADEIRLRIRLPAGKAQAHQNGPGQVQRDDEEVNPAQSGSIQQARSR